MQCELHERSARGYCPDDPGHEAEREGLFVHEETATSTVPPDPPPELPATGVGTGGLVLAAAVLLAVGVRLLTTGHNRTCLRVDDVALMC